MVAALLVCASALTIAAPAFAAPHVDSYSPSEVDPGGTVNISGRDPIPIGGEAWQIGAASAGGYTRDITELVRQWVSGGLPNHGLALAGKDETYRKANDTCAGFVGGFSLKVSYR